MGIIISLTAFPVIIALILLVTKGIRPEMGSWRSHRSQ